MGEEVLEAGELLPGGTVLPHRDQDLFRQREEGRRPGNEGIRVHHQGIEGTAAEQTVHKGGQLRGTEGREILGISHRRDIAESLRVIEKTLQPGGIQHILLVVIEGLGEGAAVAELLPLGEGGIFLKA